MILKTDSQNDNLNATTEQFPELAEEFPATPKPEIDHFLSELQANKDSWLSVPVDERIRLLKEINRSLLSIADRWINAALKAKGIARNSAGEGEEWMILAKAFRTIRLLIRSLNDIKKYGNPKLPAKLVRRANGHWVARVFPHNWLDRLLFQRISGEVWLKTGGSEEAIFSRQALAYKQQDQSGKICLVLVAGNVSDLSIVDPLCKLFIENRAVVYKTHPVNGYLAPLLQECYRPLIERNFLRIVYGGVEESAYLSHHQRVDEIHLTGSDKTYEAIVFGPGEEGEKNKRNRMSILNKPFSAELGNVSPVIIVPGQWSEKELEVQALNLASSLTFNAGFNCLSPRLLILHKGWPQREIFLEKLMDILKSVPPRAAYYSGARERYQAFMEIFPDAREFGEIRDSELPWTFISDVNPEDRGNICFRKEAFCSLFAETSLDAPDILSYIEKAVQFANETLWGSLVCSIIIQPKRLKDKQISTAVESAIENLHYGSIAVNLRTEFPYFLVEAPWGAFPGHDRYDIQSGTGKVGNTFMFEEPQKTVVRGPFKMWPNPFTVTNPNYAEFAQKMVHFEAFPAIWKLPGLIWSAVK